MSELTAAEKRKKFIDKAEKNKARFDKHLQLRKQIFGDIEPKYLETIFKSGGAIDDLFTLKMIEYAEEWHETELKNLSLCSVVQAKPEKVCEHIFKQSYGRAGGEKCIKCGKRI